MIQRNAIRIASAVLLLAVAACEDDPTDVEERDSAVVDGSRPDAGASDARVRPDAEFRPDSGNIDGPVPDAGDDVDASEPDAARDAEVVSDAQMRDSATAPDATTADAAQADAALADASADAATADASLPALAALYSFDENTGTAAADTTGKLANGALVNGATWTTGKRGSAVDLAGGTTNQYVSLPPTILESCSDITIAMWMKLGSTPSWSRLLDIDGLVDGFLYFTATEDAGGSPHLLFNIFHPPGQGADDQRVSAAYPANTVLIGVWHHVAFTLTGGMGRLYFDGVQIGSGAMTTKPSDLTIAPVGAHAWLGRSTFPDPYLDASLDDLRISCTAYSDAQVSALAQ